MLPNKIKTMALIGVLGMVLTTLSWAEDKTNTEATPTLSPAPKVQAYSDYEKKKALIICMTDRYVAQYVQEPAEEDFFPVCEKRLAFLEEKIPYQQLVDTKEHFLENLDKYSALNQPSIFKLYSEIMTGRYNAD